MPSNVTYYACFDSTGYMWFGSNDGLLRYDGTTVTQFLKETHPGLPRNEIGYFFCDSGNRIWVCTDEGLAMVDEERRIQRIEINDSLPNQDVEYCFEVKGQGMIACTWGETFFLREGGKEWEPLTWFDESIRKKAAIVNVHTFDDHRFLMIMNNRLCLVDFKSKELVMNLPLRNVRDAIRLNEKEILAVTDSSWGLYKISMERNAIIEDYSNLKNQEGSPIKTGAFSITAAMDKAVYISTRGSGLIMFDPRKQQIYSYLHDPLTDQSLSSNFPRWVIANKDGYLAVTSTSGGVNFTNVRYTMFSQHDYFKDDRGTIFDGAIVGIAEDRKQRIWLSGFSGTYIWSPALPYVQTLWKNESNAGGAFYDPGRLTCDTKGNVWASPNGNGLTIYNQNGSIIRNFTMSNSNLPSNRIRIMKQLDENRMAVGAENAFFFMNIHNFSIDTFSKEHPLYPLRKARIVDIMRDHDKMWIAASPGAAYCYDSKTAQFKRIGTENGLSSNRVYCFTKDSIGNIYAGTFNGLNIIQSNGKTRIINKQNGLLHHRVDNLVTDGNGYVWITNYSVLIRYHPHTNSFDYFDERNGVSSSGFAVTSNYITGKGQLFFGTTKGLLVINTSEPVQKPELAKQIIIHRVHDDRGFELLAKRDTVQLTYDRAKVALYYLAADLMSGNRFFYRYRLNGTDTAWSAPTKNHEVTYNLQPGKYAFRVQSSFNEGNWIDTGNTVFIIVSPPFWKTWWFSLLFISAIAAVIYLLFRKRIKDFQRKAMLRQQMTELESKALRAQMNPHFLFNSLNAIQECIVTEKVDAAYDYLSRFSRLLRMVLDHSEKNFISLGEEIETIKLYLSLEALRFKHSFSYNIVIDDALDVEDVEVPSFILQPYVENAIWHGLRMKEDEKKVEVRFFLAAGELNIEVEDNGIGRERAAEIKSQKLGAGQFESKGTALSQQRIDILNRQYAAKAEVSIIDLKDSNFKPSGTKVVIRLPIYTKNL